MSGTTLVSLGPLQISSTGVSPSALCFSKTVRLSVKVPCRDPQPRSASTPVWPLPRSLAATWRIDVASSPFARRYLENRCFFLFLGLLRCFSSPRFLLQAMCSHCRCAPITVHGFPHSEICGSSDICSSPQLIAACHVLLRLPVPRHPPYALSYLTNQVAWRSVARSFVSLLLNSIVKFLVFSVRIVVLPSHFHA